MSRFMHLQSQLLYPLQELAKQVEVSWCNEMEDYFLAVKKVLSQLPTIMAPNWDEKFYVNPSVGKYSLGATLL